MKKYKRPEEFVEAEQWFEVGDVPEVNVIADPTKPFLGWVLTLCGPLPVESGDYIVKTEYGVFPMPFDIFEQIHEEVK